MKSNPILDCAKACQLFLDHVGADRPDRFAFWFVDLRMWFHRQHCQGLIMSTAHDINFFRNLIDCAEGKTKWLEPGEPEVRSQYGDNFRKLVKMAQA